MTHTDRVTGIELVASPDQFAYEDDAGQMAFGPLCARTLFFDIVADEEAILSHMSAAPGGHEAVRHVGFTRTLQRYA